MTVGARTGPTGVRREATLPWTCVGMVSLAVVAESEHCQSLLLSGMAGGWLVA